MAPKFGIPNLYWWLRPPQRLQFLMLQGHVRNLGVEGSKHLGSRGGFCKQSFLVYNYRCIRCRTKLHWVSYPFSFRQDILFFFFSFSLLLCQFFLFLLFKPFVPLSVRFFLGWLATLCGLFLFGVLALMSFLFILLLFALSPYHEITKQNLCTF